MTTMTPAEITKAILSSEHRAQTEVRGIFEKVMPELGDCYWGERPRAAVGVIRAAIEAGEDYQAAARRAVRDSARIWCDELADEHSDESIRAKIAQAKEAL